jgi:S-DNA-T family DNA segregation ATPase FtsK/SpoIIIE
MSPELLARLAANPPMPIQTIPTALPYDTLPAPIVDRIALAEPVITPLRDGVLLIAGRRRSGRSAMLAGIAAKARRSDHPPSRILHLDPARPVPESLRQLSRPGEPGWTLLLIDDAHRWETEHPETAAALAHLAWERGSRWRSWSPPTVITYASTPASSSVWPCASAKASYSSPSPLTTDSRRRPSFSTIGPLTGQGRGLWCWEGNSRIVQVVSGPATVAIMVRPGTCNRRPTLRSWWVSNCHPYPGPKPPIP